MTTIPKPTATTAPTGEAEVSDEELKFVIPGDRRIEAANAITTRAMARRLPQLIRRSLALGWQVDRAAVIALLGVQLLSGVLEAFGLTATTGVIKPLIASQHISGDQLRSAVPSLAVLSGAIGLRALLGIASTALSRLAPRIAREAELELLDAATKAELAAYDNPGYNDHWDAADRGVEVSRDLLTQAQYILAASASLIASAFVLTAVHPILLPLLLLAALPKGVASVRAARIGYIASLATTKDRRLLGMLRWYMVDKQTADQVRSGTMARFLLDKYRTAGARIDRTTDQATWRSARISLLGGVAGGPRSVARLSFPAVPTWACWAGEPGDNHPIGVVLRRLDPHDRIVVGEAQPVRVQQDRLRRVEGIRLRGQADAPALRGLEASATLWSKVFIRRLPGQLPSAAVPGQRSPLDRCQFEELEQ
ncbi:hypothetical protein OHO28_38345 [Streptomyces europaeiscabiei]|uniref:hypothetical protein n=1 Tax=Streptomyces europaeiscabiei TaxID=146819 RepID=UPI002E1817F2